MNERNDVHAFKITIGSEPQFSAVKADRRSRIQDSAINAQALLPGGPYDLWRDDESSRRVKDLVGAFAANPRLPKMLRRKEVLDTINQGVEDGDFVASLARPDKSVRTWWRTRIDDAALKEPALELFLPDKATLSELTPGVLEPEVLPGLWDRGAATVADVEAYFSGNRIVTVQRDGYEETVAIPSCASQAIETAVSEAVEGSLLWFLNGPVSIQGEPLPSGVFTPAARLRPSMKVPTVDQLTTEALPDAWKDGRTTALALSVALSARQEETLPWMVVRLAIDDAIKSRWIQLAPDSASWPCDSAGAEAVVLTQPGTGTEGTGPSPAPKSGPAGAYKSSARLDPGVLQDLVETLPNVIKAAAGVPLRFDVHITLGDGSEVALETVETVNELLKGVSDELRLDDG